MSGFAADHGAFAALDDDAGDANEWETVPVKTAPVKAVPVTENGHATPAPPRPVPGLEQEPGRWPGLEGRGRGRGRRPGADRGRGGRGPGGRISHFGQSNGPASSKQHTNGPPAVITVPRESLARGRGGNRGRGPRGGGRDARGGRGYSADRPAASPDAAIPTASATAGELSTKTPQEIGAGAPAAAPAGLLERFQSSFTALADAAQQFAGSAPNARRSAGREGRGRGRGRRGGRTGYREPRPQGPMPGPVDSLGGQKTEASGQSSAAQPAGKGGFSGSPS